MKSNNFLKIALFGISLFLVSCTDNVMTDLTSNITADSAAKKSAGLGVKVPASSLPAAIMAYITANYSGTTITKAEKYATKYEITLSNLVKLEFKLDGTFIEVSGGGNDTGDDNHLDPSTLPVAITAYISSNYPDTTIAKAEKSATKYEVTLNTGIKLEFNLDGSFKEISGSGKNGKN